MNNEFSLIFLYLLILVLINKLLKFKSNKKIIENIENTTKNYIYKWFQKDALKNKSLPLNNLSGWKTTDKIFHSTIDNWINKLNPPIKDNESIFELGCGVGAVLNYIKKNRKSLKISGSDFSENALKKIKEIIPEGNFYHQNITKKHPVQSNSQDHVISSGALAMYLHKNEMLIAIKEGIRMTKPGGSLCFTHFIEENGNYRKSIIDEVDKSFWLKHQDQLGIENIKFFTLKHQGDRYGFVCNKINIKR